MTNKLIQSMTMCDGSAWKPWRAMNIFTFKDDNLFKLSLLKLPQRNVAYLS